MSSPTITENRIPRVIDTKTTTHGRSFTSPLPSSDVNDTGRLVTPTRHRPSGDPIFSPKRQSLWIGTSPFGDTPEGDPSSSVCRFAGVGTDNPRPPQCEVGENLSLDIFSSK